MSNLSEMAKERRVEGPRRYFDLECRRLTGLRGEEFIVQYHKDGLIVSGIQAKTLHVLIDLMIWLKLR